jgi:AraC-like DNA-binding protein
MDLVSWYPVYIPLSILIYWLGIKGWLASIQAENPKGRKSPAIDKSVGNEIIEQLRKVMEEEKLWLDPALNLSLLTKHTGIPSKKISAVLNQYLNKSFNEFVNAYRVEAIKARLLASTDKNLTIAGLAYECGFNSQPTFQRAFKSIQGESPSEFLSNNSDSVKQVV